MARKHVGNQKENIVDSELNMAYALLTERNVG